MLGGIERVFCDTVPVMQNNHDVRPPLVGVGTAACCSQRSSCQHCNEYTAIPTPQMRKLRDRAGKQP